jgi:hypothetical protein
MRIATTLFAVSVLAAAIAAGTALAGKDEVKPSVTFAKTWDLGVAEAKSLNVPLVVHNHGWH